MDSKISDLTAITETADADEIVVVDKSDTTMAASGTNKKITAVNLIPKATDAETETGTDANKLVTPAGLNSIILDEDDMSSDSDTEISTQQSIKAYIDSGVWNDGWIVGDTMTYVSATTFSVVGDQTGKYHKGAKLKMTNDGSVKMFYVVSSVYSTVTTVTVAGEVLLVSGAITLPFYSYAETPQGFPQWMDYVPTWTNMTVGNGIVDCSYTLNGHTLVLRISFTCGSTTSIGTNIRFTTPIPISSFYSVQTGLGSLYMENSGVAGYNGSLNNSSVTNTIYPIVYTVGTSYVQNGVIGTSKPFTWGTGDFFRGTLTCEI